MGNEVLSDLYGVEGGAFLDLVADNPECESIVAAEVFADTSHIHGVLAGAVFGHGIDVGAWLIEHKAEMLEKWNALYTETR